MRPIQLLLVLPLGAATAAIDAPSTAVADRPTALRAAAADDLAAPSASAVGAHYVHLAHQRYADAMAAAQELLSAVRAFLLDPSPELHEATKRAWLRAHLVYSHTEVFRFGNPNVDAWEGKVNAWPMDEGLIDYVAEGYIHHEGNPHARKNIIGSRGFPISDELIAEWASGTDPKAAPISTITDVETNVTTGFHALEFLLWGQDLSRGQGVAGQRPHTDFIDGEGATGGNSHRRRQYLSAAARLLISDLRYMVRDWDPVQGLYAKAFLALEPREQLSRILLGLGSLGFAEVASERIQVALITGDQEEEQSCFSDTTHKSIHANLLSIRTTYLGEHRLLDGSLVQGPSVGALVAALDPELDRTLRGQFEATLAASRALAEGEQVLDQLILPDNGAGRAQLEALMALIRAQTVSLEAVSALTDRLAAL